MRRRIRAAIAFVRGLIGPLKGSIAGRVDARELGLVVAAAIGAGLGADGVIEAIHAAAGRIFLDPADVGLATACLAVVAELVRRLRHHNPHRVVVRGKPVPGTEPWDPSGFPLV